MPDPITEKPLQVLTAASHNFGVYTFPHGPKANIGQVRKLLGIQYLCDDTHELFVWTKQLVDSNGNPIHDPTYDNPPGPLPIGSRYIEAWFNISGAGAGLSSVSHDQTLVGEGTLDNVLKVFNVWKPNIPTSDYRPDGSAWQLGDMAHMIQDGIEGIYVRENLAELIWQKTQCSYVPMNVQVTLIAGTYVYSDYHQTWPGDGNFYDLRGIYLVNKTLAVFGPHDFADHIAQKNLTKMNDTGNTNSINQWQPNTTYYPGQRVYLIDSLGQSADFSCFYTQVASGPIDSGGVFTIESGVFQWKLWADNTHGANNAWAMIPVGGMIGWPNKASFIPPNFMRCGIPDPITGQLTPQPLTKNLYPALYNVIGGNYGETDTNFNLPIADNFIIRVS